MKIRKLVVSVAAIAVSFAAMPAGLVTLGVPPPHQPGTPGVTTVAVGTGGCAEYMCGTNHSQVLV